MREWSSAAFVSIVFFAATMAACLAAAIHPQVVFSLYDAPEQPPGHAAAWLAVASALSYAFLLVAFCGIAIASGIVARKHGHHWLLFGELFTLGILMTICFLAFIRD